MLRPALILCAFLAAGAIAQAPAGEPAARGKLTLDAPAKVKAGSGYIKIRSSIDSTFDVFGIFEDTSIKLQSEVIGGTLILGIPNVPGAIRVTAAGIIAGKPVIAAVLITVEVDPEAKKPDAPSKPPGQPRLHVTVIGLPESAELRKGLEDAGCRYWPYQVVPANRPDLARQVAKIGQPCVIIQGLDGKVLAAKKVANEQDVADAVNTLGK